MRRELPNRGIEAVLTEAFRTDPRPAWKHLDIGDIGEQIVLISPDLGPMDRPFRNLLRRTRDNLVVWRAELPDPDAVGTYDSYVELRWANKADQIVAANTWSGYYVLIDPRTGNIKSLEFVK